MANKGGDYGLLLDQGVWLWVFVQHLETSLVLRGVIIKKCLSELILMEMTNCYTYIRNLQ